MSRVVAILILVTIASLGRQCLLVRNRFMLGSAASLLWLFAALAVVGFLGGNLAWELAGIALSLTQSLVFADRPTRMDESLFLRAANGLLRPDEPRTRGESRRPRPRPRSGSGSRGSWPRRFLVIDWRTEPDCAATSPCRWWPRRCR